MLSSRWGLPRISHLIFFEFRFHSSNGEMWKFKKNCDQKKNTFLASIFESVRYTSHRRPFCEFRSIYTVFFSVRVAGRADGTRENNQQKKNKQIILQKFWVCDLVENSKFILRGLDNVLHGIHRYMYSIVIVEKNVVKCLFGYLNNCCRLISALDCVTTVIISFRIILRSGGYKTRSALKQSSLPDIMLRTPYCWSMRTSAIKLLS